MDKNVEAWNRMVCLENSKSFHMGGMHGVKWKMKRY